LTKAPSSLLEALEQHLNTLEGKKTSAANTPTQARYNIKADEATNTQTIEEQYKYLMRKNNSTFQKVF
jgi:hypothetical protein